MFDPVPWFVGGAAEHSTNVARLLAYAAFGGREGVIGPKDLEVRELAVPGTQVRVFPGAVAVLNRAAGIKYEAYAARLPQEETVDIAATGAGGVRSDLIVARVENPFIEGEDYPAPLDPTVGPYVFARVISNVPATTKTAAELGLGESAVALARIDLPVSTGTVEQSHIVDLRRLCQVLRHREQNIAHPAGSSNLGHSVWGWVWPLDAKMTVNVPEWATSALVHGVVAGAIMPSGSTSGNARIDLGGVVNPTTGSITTPGQKSQVTAFNLDNQSAFGDRTDLHAGGAIAVPASMRGATVSVQIEAYKISGTVTLSADQYSTCWLDVEFTAEPTTNL